MLSGCLRVGSASGDRLSLSRRRKNSMDDLVEAVAYGGFAPTDSIDSRISWSEKDRRNQSKDTHDKRRSYHQAALAVTRPLTPNGATALDPQLVLVDRSSRYPCKMVHAKEILARKPDVAMLLDAGDDLAVVALESFAWEGAANTNEQLFTVPLGIGPAEDALEVTFDGRCLFTRARRSPDSDPEKVIICAFEGGLFAGNSLVVNNSFTYKRRKEFMVDEQGNLYPVSNPAVVLGIEPAGQPMDGCWLCMHDELTVLTSSKGVARFSNGTLGTLALHKSSHGNYASLKYENGAAARYRVDENRNLVQPDQFVVWQWWAPAGKSNRATRSSVAYRNSIFRCIEEHEKHPTIQRKGSSVAQLLESGTVRMLRGSYFETCLEANTPIQMRQQVPEERFWDGRSAVDLWDRFGRLFFVIVSYGWLSKDHPDPECFHLRRLVGIIRKLRQLAQYYVISDVGVVIDYCSLWQVGETGRTQVQTKEFEQGISGFLSMYSHTHTTAVKLTGMPEDELRKYEDRGWTLAESIFIDAKSGEGNRLSFGNDFNPDEESRENYAFLTKYGPSCSNPPVVPGKFRRKLQEQAELVRDRGLKLFSTESDYTLVPELYNISFEHIRTLPTMSYRNCGYTDDDVIELCEVLREAHTLTLTLDHNKIGDVGVSVLCDALAHVKMIQRLCLHYNQIEESGAKRLEKFFEEVPSLVSVTLNNNPFVLIHQCVEGLRDAWAAAGKDIRLLVM